VNAARLPNGNFARLFVGFDWVTNEPMFSLKSSLVIAAAAGLSLALLAGCKTTKPEPAPAAAPAPTPFPVITNKPAPPPATNRYDSGDNMGPNILAWDATRKEYHAKPGEMSAPFTFSMTNISSGPVTIYDTSTTCECTVAKLPSVPWVVPSGGYGIIEASINLTNKTETVTNSVIISTSKGNRRLNLIVFLPEQAK
jgi:uncharacterized protein DUF1573